MRDMIFIRDFQVGDERALWAVRYSAVHQLAIADYSAEQCAAWTPPDRDPAEWAAKIQSIRPFVAELNGRIVGYGDLQPSGYIDHFFVAGDAARRGIGSALMRHIQEAAVARGIASLYSDVSITARPFFEHWGFVVESAAMVEVRGVALQNYRMRKSLSA
jgi:putative acetyltransferase